MSVHIVFSAECNTAMTWQAVGLFHSFRTSGQAGNITRLLACSDDQLASYRGLDIGPTFVHHNMRVRATHAPESLSNEGRCTRDLTPVCAVPPQFGHPLIDEVGYPSYNKPASVHFFLQAVEVREREGERP